MQRLHSWRKLLCPQSQWSGSPEGDTGQTKFCRRSGDFCERKPFSAGLAGSGVNSLASEAPEDWGAGKQESGFILAFSPQMWDVWQHWIFITRESMCSCKGSLTSSNNLWLNNHSNWLEGHIFPGFKPVCSPLGPWLQCRDEGSAELSSTRPLFLRLRMGSGGSRDICGCSFILFYHPHFSSRRWWYHILVVCGASAGSCGLSWSLEQDASVICSGLSPWLHVPQEATWRGSDPQPVSRPSTLRRTSPAYLRVSYPIDAIMIETNLLTCFLSQ